jgi:hypothetical protein
MAGGNWDNGVHCGSRCANSNNNPENVNTNTGLRCVCDHLFCREDGNGVAVT